MKVTKQKERATVQGPDAWFTGEVTVEMLFTAQEPGRVSAARVTFPPGARTAWHSHPYGQALIVREGRGFVQEWDGAVRQIGAGDVVWFAAGEKHCYGAAPDSAMSHLALQEARDGGRQLDGEGQRRTVRCTAAYRANRGPNRDS